MKSHRQLDLFAAAVGAAACSFLLSANLAVAEIQGSRIEPSSERSDMVFDVNNASRREVIDRLFAGSGIEIKWISPGFAEDRIGGKFSGKAVEVLRQFLAHTNFVIVHNGSGEASRIVRLVIVGPAKGGGSSADLAALAAAIKLAKGSVETIGSVAPQPESPKDPAQAQTADAAPAPAEAPTRSVSSRTDSREPSIGLAPAPADLTGVPHLEPSGDASGILKPPPAGETAPVLSMTQDAELPRLVPPPGVLNEVPFRPALPGAGSPTLGPAPSGRGHI